MASTSTAGITEGRLIRSALGESWNALTPKTQKRFETDPDRPVEYTGRMTEVRSAFIGKCIARFSVMFGSPLIPYDGRDVPIDVIVYKKPGNADVFKKRTYFFPGRKPFVVETHMHVNGKKEFVEYAGMGLGMTMEVKASGGKLYFHGLAYRLSLGSIHIPIPAFLSPGIAHIEHSDYGENQFRVRIEMRHPWLGILFVQDGIFGDKP